MGARSYAALLGATVLACSAANEPRIEELRALQVEGQFAETMAPLAEMLDEDPDAIELHRLYARALFAVHGPSAALWRLRKVAESPQRTANDGIHFARSLVRGGAQEEALAVVEGVLESEPNHAEALLLRAAIHLDLERWEALLESAEAANVVRKRPSVAHLWQARALAKLDRFDAARQLLRSTSAQIDAGSRDDSLRQACCRAEIDVAELAGDDTGVIEQWDACLTQWPSSIELVSEAVAFFDARGDVERATALLEAALAAAPRSIVFRSKLAERLAAKRPEAAEEMLLDATELEDSSDAAWLALADFYRNRGSFAAAVRASGRVLDPMLERTDAKPPSLLFAQYADDLIQAGELEKAREVTEKLDRPEYAALLRGRLLLAQGDPAAALEGLEEGLRLWPANSGGRWLAGKAAEQLGDFDRAIAEYRNALRGDIENDDALFRLASLYEREGNPSAALYVLQLRTRRIPDDVRANAEIVRLALMLGSEGVAADALEALRDNPAARAAAALAGARIMSARDGAVAGARALESEGLDLARVEHAEVLRFLVERLITGGRQEDALRHTEAALAAAPDTASFHEIHAEAQRANRGSSDEVERSYRRALALEATRATALAGLARLAAEAGRVDEAWALYEQAIAVDPDDTGSAWASIELALASDRSDGLDSRLDALLAADPPHAQAAELRARRLLSAGDLDRAELLSQRAVRFQGGASALEARGLVALAREDPRRAARAFGLSLQLRPDSSTTQYLLARALAELEDAAGARQALRKALAGGEFPEAAAAREALEALDAEHVDG